MSTDLSDLLTSQPPPMPQSTSFMPEQQAPPVVQPSYQSNPHKFEVMRYTFKSLLSYLGFFIGAFVISLSTPRSMILQYIPNTYTTGGVPSYMGSAILGAVAVAISYVINTIFGSFL